MVFLGAAPWRLQVVRCEEGYMGAAQPAEQKRNNKEADLVQNLGRFMITKNGSKCFIKQ